MSDPALLRYIHREILQHDGDAVSQARTAINAMGLMLLAMVDDDDLESCKTLLLVQLGAGFLEAAKADLNAPSEVEQ